MTNWFFSDNWIYRTGLYFFEKKTTPRQEKRITFISDQRLRSFSQILKCFSSVLLFKPMILSFDTRKRNRPTTQNTTLHGWLKYMCRVWPSYSTHGPQTVLCFIKGNIFLKAAGSMPIFMRMFELEDFENCFSFGHTRWRWKWKKLTMTKQERNA